MTWFDLVVPLVATRPGLVLVGSFSIAPLVICWVTKRAELHRCRHVFGRHSSPSWWPVIGPYPPSPPGHWLSDVACCSYRTSRRGPRGFCRRSVI